MLLAVFLIVGLAACGKDAATPDKTPEPATSPGRGIKPTDEDVPDDEEYERVTITYACLVRRFDYTNGDDYAKNW